MNLHSMFRRSTSWRSTFWRMLLWSVPALALTLSTGSLLIAEEPFEAWPRFRGANGEGIGAGVNLAPRPTLKNSLLWKLEFAGDGNGSPVAWGPNLYLQSAEENGKTRKLIAIDALKGTIAWEAALAGRSAKTHAKNSLASSTPACDEKGVYSVFWDGTSLHAAAHTHQGKELWVRELGTFKSQHGAGHSPVTFEGKIYINFDQDDKAELVCLDGANGKTIWLKERQAFRSSYSTPILRPLPDGKSELVVVSTAGATGYDPATGNLNWDAKIKHAKNALRVVSSPLIAGELLVFGGGDGSGERQMQAIKIGQSDGTPVWEDLKSFPYVPTGIVVGSLLFEISDKGFLGVYEVATGKSLSQTRLGGAFSASAVLAGNRLVLVSENGEVFFVEPKPNPDKPASLALNEPVFATPAIYKNRLYIKSRKTLFCLGQASTAVPNGEER